MARMQPESPRPSTESPAERVMFTALRDGTSDDFVAYHSVAWLVPGEGAPRQGEADFVVAHPKLGTAIIEVKGGAIRYDAALAKWWSGQHEIVDPFEQARRSSHVLRESVSRVTGKQRGSLQIGYGVAFPDIQLRDVDLRMDAPREIVLSAGDLNDTEAGLRRLFGYWRGRNASPAIPIAALDTLLAKSFELPAPLGVRLGRHERELLTLTEQQYDILDKLARQTRVAICGCAGSGKTFIAAEKARRLAAQGFRVLLVCFNRFLAKHLQRGLADAPGIDALAFDELCERVVRDVRGELPDPDGGGRYWDELRRQFADAASERAGTYDALIVDEAQDIQRDWWLPLQILLKDPDKSPLYVFYDDNQRIFHTPKELPVPTEPVQLTVNCRNTQRIHSVVAEYYSGSTTIARGPEGVPVSLSVYKTRKELLEQLDESIRRWIRDAGIKPEDIALLTPHGVDASSLWWKEKLGGIRLTDDPWEKGAVLRSSVFRFKGLERLVVAVVELEDAGDQELYIAYSRASVFLAVFCPESEQQRVRGHITRVSRAAAARSH